MAHKIAFVGAGRLASAIVRGLLAQKVFSAGEIACTSKSGDSARKLAAETGIAHLPDLRELLGSADIVVVAFKPQSLASADGRLGELCAGKLVVSLMAGKRLDRLAQVFPQARNIVRTMTNTPAAIGRGITAYCSLSELSPADRGALGSILGALGSEIQLAERDFDAVTGLSGSGPGYIFEFTDALVEAGIAAGLAPEVAKQLVTQTLIGSAELLARSKADPRALRDQVISPNGTTAAGLEVLANWDFRGAIIDCVGAATARSGALSQS